MDRTWYFVVLFLAKENKDITTGIAAIAACQEQAAWGK